MLATATFAQARPYTLQWDANSDGITTGYLISYGTAPGSYGSTADIDVGNVTSFQVDLLPGTTYYFIVKAYTATRVLGPASAELSFLAPIATLTVSSTSVSAGAAVNAVVLNGPANPLDRVGLFAVGSSTQLDWKYLNGTQTAPTVGLTSATLSFAMPTAGGQYNFRFFANGSTTVSATSPTVTVAAPPTSITPSATTVTAGSALTATVANGPGNRLDWVALYPVGSNAAVDWKYLNGTRTAPTTGVTGATLTFTMPTTGGQYVLRLFASSASAFVATSPTVTVTGGTTNTVVNGSPSITPSATSVTSGSNLSAAVANGPGNRLDWVALYPVGSNAAVDWQYLNGTRTAPTTGVTGATLTFTMPTGGQYVLRLFSSNASAFVVSSPTVTVTGTVVTGSPSITPSATSVTSGSNLSAAVANGPGNRLDWVALYPVGSNAAVDWQYLNGTRTAPTTGVTGATLTFTMPTTGGQYVLRLFSSSASAFVAMSPTVTVTGTVVTGSPSITPSATSVTRGSNLTVTIANGPGHRLDWVAMYPVGSNSFVDWQYLNGTRTPPTTGVTGVALTFRMPNTGGQYVLRFFSSSASKFVAMSPTVTVQ